MLAWTLASSGAAAQTPPTESAVKAAYLFRFLAYVEWPPAALPPAGEPIVVGVLGAEAVAAALPSIVAGRRLDGRPVVARSLASPAASLDGVHVLFIGRSMPAERVIARLGNRPVLVVTDGESDAGGMLNFVVVDGRVRFEAVPAAAEQAGLKLGARLLAVAERVHRP
jgi:YfiR/HmsC-like